MPLSWPHSIAARRMRQGIRPSARLEMAGDLLRRARVLVVCGDRIDETVKNDVALAERLRITATTLDGILTVHSQGCGKGNPHRG